jgi:molybdopterin-guanine dinucleotide biosynthesis protein A
MPTPSNNPIPQIEAFVLAGGRSTRMGQDKALLRLHNRTLLEITLSKLPNPRIAAARPDLASYAPIVPDIHPGCGPLSGIEAALLATAQPLNLFLPVDLPLLPPQFLHWMVQRAELTGALATIPRVNGRPQPLSAVYHRDLLPGITRSLTTNNYKVLTSIAASTNQIDLFDLEHLASTNSQWHTWSAVHRWFHNCNTPEDLSALENALVLNQ